MTNFCLTAPRDKDTIEEGIAILEKMRECLLKSEEFREAANFEDYSLQMDKVAKLNSEYLEVIPKINPELISSILHIISLDSEIELLRSIYTLSFTIRAVLGAYINAKKINPYDYLLGCLPAKLEILSTDSDQGKLILDYVNASKNSSYGKLVNIIKVDGIPYDKDEDRKFFGNENHMMLWHGTSDENIMSIIKEGLKIHPPQAQLTGSRFGKGIYFSDSFSMSHCYSVSSNTVRYILLCEVALGRVANMLNPSVDGLYNSKYFDTVRAMSSSGPDWDSSLIWDGKFLFNDLYFSVQE